MPASEIYMRRALQLAALGKGGASPNPMVGAVIVAPDGRVIGEGWHRVRGLGHAEVNAVASVSEADKPLLSRSTMYVTLEPCSHYGKTPPCAELILRTGISHVVIATTDPNPKVAGRGIAMLREGGVEVEVGMLCREARELNRRFFTSQLLRRPWITLKWACSADGFMDRRRTAEAPGPQRFSTPLTTLSTMRLRSLHDVILTTSSTALADHCSLTVRGWYGRQPLRFVIDRHGRLPQVVPLLAPVECRAADSLSCESEYEADRRGLAPAVVLTPEEHDDPAQLFASLYKDYGISSVLVEAGPTFLRQLIDCDLWDAARVEIAPFSLWSEGTCPAPTLPARYLASSTSVKGPEAGTTHLMWFHRPTPLDF